MAATPAMFSVIGLTSLGDQRVPSGEVRLSLDLRIPIDPGHGPDPGSADTRGNVRFSGRRLAGPGPARRP